MTIKRNMYAAVLAAGLALYALPLMAAEADEAKAGLPQLDTSLFPEQLVWLAVSFSVLYLLMRFVALPRVQDTQDKRKDVIVTDLSAAEKANEAAKAIIAHYEKTLADARVSARASVIEALAASDRNDAAQQAAQHQELTKRLREADAKITAARDAAINETRANAADLAQAIVEKILGVKTGAKV